MIGLYQIVSGHIIFTIEFQSFLLFVYESYIYSSSNIFFSLFLCLIKNILIITYNKSLIISDYRMVRHV